MERTGLFGGVDGFGSPSEVGQSSQMSRHVQSDDREPDFDDQEDSPDQDDPNAMPPLDDPSDDEDLPLDEDEASHQPFIPPASLPMMGAALPEGTAEMLPSPRRPTRNGAFVPHVERSIVRAKKRPKLAQITLPTPSPKTAGPPPVPTPIAPRPDWLRADRS